MLLPQLLSLVEVQVAAVAGEELLGQGSWDGVHLVDLQGSL